MGQIALDGWSTARPVSITPWAPAVSPFDASRDRRRRRGHSADAAGRGAEARVAAAYRRRGARILAERLRMPGGELDLVALLDGVLVFVEVKRRRDIDCPDSPVSARQWQRLEWAALHYMMEHRNETGACPACRFDVALVGHDERMRIVENARSFD